MGVALYTGNRMHDTTERRKLTAILSADAQGYSRLMGDDDTLTVETLTRYRELFEGCIGTHGGRVVNAPGDAVLAEFPSVVDAVRCSVLIQDRLAEANAELADHRRMDFRIGVNLGDVIEKGNDIYGDGVNIAARVEAMADGGGVCITRPVYDQVKNRLPQVAFADMGEHTVKNIAEPVRVYRVVRDAALVHDSDPAQRLPEPSPPASGQAVSIAVVPFENLSGKREHDYFSIGFVEDLITDLAHFANLRVISSYSSQKMKADPRGVLSVAAELGIDYLLTGNLRRLKGNVRISSQLMETAGGRVLWADRYDAPVDTLFDIQDDIVARVVSAISNQIDRALLAAARKKPAIRMAAYDFWLRGMARLRQGTPEADREARRMFKQALAVDPHCSRAYAGLSLSHFNDWSCQLWEQWETTERKAYDYAMRAHQLDESDHVVQMILGRILLFRRHFDLAAQHLDRSLALNANDADNLVQIGACMAFLGDPERGERLYLKSLQLNPYRESWYYTYGALSYMIQRRYDTFLETALKGPLTDVWVDLPAYIAAAYGFKGDRDEASRYLKLAREAFTQAIFNGHEPGDEEIASWMRKANPFKRAADFDHILEGLVLAGLKPPAAAAVKAAAEASNKKPVAANVFRKAGRLWRMTFEDRSVQLPEVKGFLDMAVLLAQPGVEAHCTQLMGSVVQADDSEQVIDAQARREYETRIRDLQEEIADAEAMNDLGRREVMEAELDQLTAHLAKALGLGGKTRSVNTPVDRSRSAVTWRIRSAIRKIGSAHPALGSHLSHSIRTGTFCCYEPEKEQNWQL
jgi:class 3 adenylate cyclase/TolB-like protein/tetratricopeptide (TPR) repeat protein